MSLPLTRNRNYAQGVQIESADLNDLQDQVIGGKHGYKELLIPASAMHTSTAAPADFSGTRWTENSGSDIVYAPIALHVGDVITAIEVYGFESAADEYDCDLYETNLATGGDTNLGNKTSGTTNAWTSVTYTTADANIPLTLLDDRAYQLRIDLTGAGVIVLAVKVTYYRP